MTDFKKGLLYGIVIAISFGIFVAEKIIYKTPIQLQ